MKKLLAFVCAIVLFAQCIVLCPTKAQAAEIVDSGSCGDNLNWTLDSEGTLTISGSGEITSVPWNTYTDQIQTVVVKKGVTSICRYAFDECINLTSLSLPSGLISIGEWAFQGCVGLTELVLPDGLQTIDNSAFNNCDGIGVLTISSSVTTLGACAFGYCDSLSRIFFQGDMPAMDGAFNGVEAFAYYPPDNTTWESWDKFNSGGDIEWLGSLSETEGTCGENLTWELENDVLTISGTGPMTEFSSRNRGPWTASYETIKQIIIEDGVTSIGACAFSQCRAVETVSIPESVTHIGQQAFIGCHALISVKLPAGLTMIDDFTFGSCYSLAEIVIPDGVTEIGFGAFRECTSLESVTIPSSVECIQMSCFESCTSLRDVIIETGVKTIEDSAFHECTSLVSVTFPPSLEYLGDVFYLSGVSQVTFTGDAPKLSSSLFFERTVTAYYPEGNSTWTQDVLQNYGGDVKWIAKVPPATIATQPKTAYTQSGSTAKVTVKALGEGLTYQWYVKNAGASKFTKSSITSATYSTKMNDKSKDRQVYCVVTDKYGNTAKSKTVYLRMAASVTTQPKSAYVQSGSTAKVTVQAAGDGLTYQWYVKSVGDSKYYKSSVTSATYATKMNDKSRERLLYCVVTDKYGNSVKSKTVALHMTASITTQPKTTYTKSGSTAKVTVEAAGDGLTYQWYIKSAGATKFTKSSVTSATYATKMSSTSKDRQVYCVVTDKYGKTVKTNTVYLRMAATITSQPTSVSVEAGEKATVKVKAVGDGLTYKWYYAEKGSSTFKLTTTYTGTTYSVTMNDARDGRRVYCVVTDKYGKTVKSNTVTISMK